jgi:UDPglucose 6-dehydrogenase
VFNSGYRRDWVLRTLHREMHPTGETPRVAVWGLAYKQHTRSIKNSPSVALLENLRGHDVSVYDPQAVFAADPPPHVGVADSPLEACTGADALIVMTPWPEFAAVDLHDVYRELAGTLVIDPLGCLDEAKCRTLGLSYYKLGVHPLPKEHAA